MIQLQCLNKILGDKDYSIISENNLTDIYFSEYKDEFNYIKNHFETYGVVPDVASFVSKFSTFDVISVADSNDYLLGELYNDYNTRKLAETFNAVRQKIIVDDVDGAMKVFNDSVASFAKKQIIKPVDILKDISRYDDYVDRIGNFKKFYISTGFSELDSIIGGWDRQEEIVTIAARTNMGKTWVLLKSAIAAAEQGLTVGIYSGEMSERKVGYRIDTLVSHISNRKIMQGDASVQNDYKKYLESLSDRFGGSLKVLTPAMVNGAVGVSALKMFVEKEHLDVLCVDQHSLLEDDRNAKSPVERAANISKDLKLLQVTKKIPIITVSQQNRTSTENGLDTTHIAASDRIAQDSTIVIMFEQKECVLTMHLVKARDASNGKDLKYALDFDKGIFTYIPTEKDALDGKQCNAIKDEYDATLTSGEDVF